MQEKSILLIEDDELDVISFERSLRKISGSYKLYTAFNGVEALEILSGEGKYKLSQLPDIIILDLNMPKMNGVEFLQAIRKNPAYDEVKVFVMTTSNETSDRMNTEKLRISGYFIKPLNFTDNNKKNSSMENFMHFQLVKILGY